MTNTTHKQTEGACPVSDKAQLKEMLSARGSVCVIGSRGRMGAMLMNEGEAAGFGMAGLDLPMTDLSPVSKAKIVILCVPVPAIEEVLASVCPQMDPTAVLCDITSVKERPMTSMLKVWQGDVVGTHPLFGPVHDKKDDLPVAMVKSSRCSDESYALCDCFFSSLGFRTFATDAKTHDKAMARIHNINFVTSLAFCAQTALDKSLTDFITPSFRRRLAAAKKMLTEDAPMYSFLFEANPYSQQAVRQFSFILSLASAGDIDLLLSRARQWWPEDES